MTGKADYVAVAIVQGQARASVIRAHLESEGIPAYLKYESAGLIYGILADGLGEVKIMVPADMAAEARKIIEPVAVEDPEDESGAGGTGGPAE